MTNRLRSIATARPVVVEAPRGECPRSEVRHPVYRHGALVVAGGVELACAIVDMSQSGARVHLDGATALPDFVNLKVAATATVRRARVVWKRDNAAGLSFQIEQKPNFVEPSRLKLTSESSQKGDHSRQEGD